MTHEEAGAAHELLIGQVAKAEVEVQPTTRKTRKLVVRAVLCFAVFALSGLLVFALITATHHGSVSAQTKAKRYSEEHYTCKAAGELTDIIQQDNAEPAFRHFAPHLTKLQKGAAKYCTSHTKDTTP